jgi:hypothetical protein
MRSHAFMDCRNVYDPRELGKVGFEYAGVGRSVEATAPWVMEEVIVRESDDAWEQPAVFSGKRG